MERWEHEEGHRIAWFVRRVREELAWTRGWGWPFLGQRSIHGARGSELDCPGQFYWREGKRTDGRAMPKVKKLSK